MMKKYVPVLSWLLLSLFGLSACSYPYAQWENQNYHSKAKKNTFTFVPLYSDDELNQSFIENEHDSKPEQLYQTSSQTAAFRNITFATDSFTIKGEENLSILSSLVRHMQKNTKVTLYIEGHTDERGAAAYNLALGARRASAVKQYLIKQGISADRLFTVSYGKEHPISTDHNELAWQQNRRTEFKVHVR